MDPLTDSDRQAYATVESALRTSPLAEVPSGFSARVLRRLPPRPALPRFRLKLLDWVVSLCGASLVGAMWLCNLLLPPQVAAYLRVNGLLAWQFLRLQLRGASDVMIGGLLLALVGLGMAAFLFGRSAFEKRLWRAG